jgi:EmrB/QacA subfamily drug resistance transporter
MDAAPSVLSDAADDPTGLDAAPVFTHEQILRVVVGILLCILLAAIDQTVVVPAVPSIAADLNGFSHLSWIVTAYLLTSTVATPIYGKLSDIYGRRALLLPAIVLFVVASLLCGFAQSLMQLIVARALQGLGGAGLMAMAQAAIADVVSPRERGRYQGYMAGTWGVASVAGPILGGWMTDYLSWRWIFWINLPIGIAAFLLSSSALKMLQTKKRPARIDYVGSALLAAFTTAALLVMSWGGSEYGWTSPTILGLAAAAVALLVLLIMQERANGDPLLPPRLFINAVFSRGVLIAALNSGAMFGATFLLPLFFQLVRGADASLSGTLIVPYLGANCVGAFTGGQIARRLGRVKILIQIGVAATVVGFGLLATIDAATPPLLSMGYMLFVGLGIGVVMPCTLVMIQNAAERRDVGSATGAFLFLRSMGGAVGSTLTGVVLAGQFAASVARGGFTVPVDLGSLRVAAGAASTLDAATQASAHIALSGAFHAAFAVCAVLAALALAATWGLVDKPLRTTG